LEKKVERGELQGGADRPPVGERKNGGGYQVAFFLFGHGHIIDIGDRLSSSRRLSNEKCADKEEGGEYDQPKSA